MAKILVVSDTCSIRQLVQEWLMSMGHVSTLTNSGEVAFNELKKGGYDLIISDYILPGITGVELAKMICESELRPDFPFMIFSGTNPNDCSGHCKIWEYISTWLEKPCNFLDFSKEVDSLLNL